MSAIPYQPSKHVDWRNLMGADTPLDPRDPDPTREGTDHSMDRTRPYSGLPWTDTGTRGATEIKGITFRDLRDAFIRAVIMSAFEIVPDALYREAEKGEDAALCEADLYGWDLNRLDPMAVCQNLSCEVERLMGIFPNVPKLDLSDD